MKKIFKKFLALLSRHKLLTIICFLALIATIVMGYVFFNVFIGGNSKYGDRLDGIEEVTISSKDKKEIASTLEEKEEVTSASVRVQGKIIYINIVFTRATSLDKAKEIAKSTLTSFDEDELKFYDIGYYLTQEEVENKEDIGFVALGTKNAKLDNISWTKS